MLMLFDDIRAASRAKFEAIDRGQIILNHFLRPCRLKILMVVDGYPGQFLNISFGDSYFGLATLADTLRDNPEWWVKFDVTRAHRQTDSFKPNPVTEPELHARYGPHFEGFRFTQPGFDINQYDQAWFFGARSNPNDPERLTDAELEIIARWMDTKQGGVFATGDHADLGAALCARLPRARTMRRWTSTAATNVVPMPVPQNFGPDRHDTLLKGDDAFYTFNDESDIYPMPLTLKRKPLISWSPFFSRSAPHPVMCGTTGAIDIMPDHPHEGWVTDEADVATGLNFSFGSYSNKPEYPTVAGHQEKPEVIAKAHVQGDHTEGRSGASGTDRNKGPANAKTFGVVGAYDGHVANVGRVVVDSTWHHWFDVNLTGRPTDGGDQIDPVLAGDPKAKGYLYNAAGQAAFARIQNYFRNVALWIASPNMQHCMFTHATWNAVIRYPLNEQMSPLMPIWVLGETARDAIGRRAGQCTITQWIWRFFPIEVVEIFRPRPNPCLTCPPFDAVEIFTLGGIVREMLTLAYDSRDGKASVDEKSLAQAMANGISRGLKELLTLQQRSLEQAPAHLKTLSKVLKVLPEAETFMPEGDKAARKKVRKVASKAARKTAKSASRKKR
jgi:hypothetical protein